MSHEFYLEQFGIQEFQAIAAPLIKSEIRDFSEIFVSSAFLKLSDFIAWQKIEKLILFAYFYREAAEVLRDFVLQNATYAIVESSAVFERYVSLWTEELLKIVDIWPEIARPIQAGIDFFAASLEYKKFTTKSEMDCAIDAWRQKEHHYGDVLLTESRLIPGYVISGYKKDGKTFLQKRYDDKKVIEHVCAFLQLFNWPNFFEGRLTDSCTNPLSSKDKSCDLRRFLFQFIFYCNNLINIRPIYPSIKLALFCLKETQSFSLICSCLQENTNEVALRETINILAQKYLIVALNILNYLASGENSEAKKLLKYIDIEILLHHCEALINLLEQKKNIPRYITQDTLCLAITFFLDHRCKILNSIFLQNFLDICDTLHKDEVLFY